MKKVSFFSFLMSIALGSLMLTSCNKDSCGYALADLVISLNASQSQIQTGQRIDLFSAVSNVQQYCTSEPSAGIAAPSESEIAVEKYDTQQRKYIRVGGTDISDPSLNPTTSNNSTTPITFNQPGLYRITATTDVSKVVKETKEGNNTSTPISFGRQTPFIVTGETIENTPTITFGKTQSKIVSE